MDFTLSAEQLAVRETARAVAESFGGAVGASGPASAPPEADAARARLWRELARADLLSYCLPEKFGGSAGDLLGLCVLLEELGHGIAAAPVLETAVAAMAVDRFGSPRARERWLPAAGDGSAVLTIAPARGTLTAVPGDGGWLVTGTAPFVTYPDAARLLATADAGHRQLAVLVDPAAPGVRRISYTTTSGLPEAELRFDNVEVSEDDVLAGGAGGDVAGGAGQWVWDRAVVGTCALLAGIASGALARTARYTSQREQFGRVIATFQAVALHAGDAFIDTEAMRLTTWQAAWRLSAGRPADREISVAKFWASEGASRVTATAQHLHGGMGVVTDYPLHRYLLWAKQLELSLGSASWHLSRLAAQLEAPR
ncbi:MAG TPA: acyl-CoA dehydrogenase family protein [Trebonia sp.]|nr:acyl-CoA dehydrogenase family protein [Trebonia sp.]